MSQGQFATCLNCIDGRFQQSVADWIKKEYHVDYIDMITAPGIDGLIAKSSSVNPQILDSIRISIDNHDSHHVFIVGHEDCAGNPQSEEEHKNHIKISIDKISPNFPFVKVIGLWATLNNNVEVISP